MATRKRHKRATCLYLEPAQLAGLHAMAARLECTTAYLIRLAIDGLLNPTPEEMLDALERAQPGFCARLSPAQREHLARALVTPL